MTNKAWVALGGLIVTLLVAWYILSGAINPEPTPSVEPCKAAMRTQIQHALSNASAPPSTKPPECEGFTDSELEQFGTEILEEAFSDR